MGTSTGTLQQAYEQGHLDEVTYRAVVAALEAQPPFGKAQGKRCTRHYIERMIRGGLDYVAIDGQLDNRGIDMRERGGDEV